MENSNSWRAYFVLLLKGFGMGAADVVPGVSGGTMALILGIYQRWLEAIKSFDGLWLKALVTFDLHTSLHRPHFGFVLPVGIGVFSALLFFTRIVPLPELLHIHPEPIYGLFFGLIVGSIITLFHSCGPLRWDTPVFVGIGIALGWTIVNLVPVNTPDAAWFIFLSGFIAICALMLPGISGSFILLILRKYDTVMSAIGHFKFGIILPFALGALAGFVVFSRILTWLLERFHRAALLIINGILIGALWVIWPFQAREYIVVREKQRLISVTPQWPEILSDEGWLALGLMLMGLIAVLVLHRLAHNKKNPSDTEQV